MKLKVMYEWDFETSEPYDEVNDCKDILDHSHWDKLKDSPFEPSELNDELSLVLVRQTYHEDNGVFDRWYAYAKQVNGQWVLPETFDHSPSGYKVPQKYHREIKAWRNSHG